ncbi:glycosyltransferase family 2 protein [Polaribacter sp. M15]
MKLPNISIGIPVYNQVNTIASTIESVLGQTNSPFEIVISENHSTDGTREVVEKYSDQVRIVSPPKHLTMSENWDFCVKSCKGEWVGLISGDDTLLPNYIASMQKGIVSNLEAVFIMGGWQVVNAETKTTTNRFLLSMSHFTSPPSTTKMLLSGPKASFAAFCFKKSTYIEIGGYDQRFHLIQDWILQFDLSFRGNFIKIDDLVAKYYIYERIELEKERVSIWVKDYLQYLNIKIWDAQGVGITRNEILENGQKVIVFVMNKITVQDYTCTELELNEINAICKKFECEKIYIRWIANRNKLIYLDNYLKRKSLYFARSAYSFLKSVKVKIK